VIPPNETGKPARPRARDFLRWLVALTIVATSGACFEDRSSGFFTIRASDGVRAEIRGPVYAKTEESFTGYWVMMDLTQQASLLRGAENLALGFASKPDTGTWSGNDTPVPSGRNVSIAFNVNSCGPTIHWNTDSAVGGYLKVDSGRVHVTAPARQRGVSGTFSIFAELRDCGADSATQGVQSKAPRQVRLEGAFETREPARHRLRSLLRFLDDSS